MVANSGAEFDQIERALRTDMTIDIVSTGARTGRQRVTEIWFMNIDGQIYICGTPASDGSDGGRRPRDWMANVAANPEFEFCFKESIQICLPAVAEAVADRDERTKVMTAPETQWYRDQGISTEALIDNAPMIRVRFTGEMAPLSP